MQIKNKYTHVTKRRKYLIFAVVIALLTIPIGVYSFGLLSAHRPSETQATDTINYQPASQEEIKAGDEVKKDSVNPSDTKDNSVEQDSTTQKQNIDIDITHSSRSGQYFSIGVMIQKVLTSGECKLTMTSTSGKSYSNSAAIQPVTNYSTCKGFEIPLSDLSSEEWTIYINIENTNYTGKVSQTVEIEL